MSELLEERDGLRVRLVLDNFPVEPYDGGRSPIVRLWPLGTGGGWWRADHQDILGGYAPAAIGDIVSAAEKWAGEPDLFDRYLRMFHGTTGVQWFDARHGSGFVYVTFDTADWRAHHGIPDGQAGAVDMSDWRAYCEGEVYGYVIEQRAIWRRDGTGEIRTSWESVDSCFGFYGHSYAEDAAREAFDGLLSELPVIA